MKKRYEIHGYTAFMTADQAARWNAGEDVSLRGAYFHLPGDYVGDLDKYFSLGRKPRCRRERVAREEMIGWPANLTSEDDF